MPRVLITRPLEDAAPLRARLEQMGISTLNAPVLQINNLQGPPLKLDNVQGFLLTSANGVRALAGRTERRDIAVYAVGDATAGAARHAGFTHVLSAEGDVDDLARLVVESAEPAAGTLLHATSSVTAGDLTGALTAAGFMVRREMLYEAVPVASLPSDVLEAMKDDSLDGVIVYSPRTARRIETLVATAGLESALARLSLFALSRNVSEAATMAWGQRIIAGHPDQESLLHAVQTWYY